MCTPRRRRRPIRPVAVFGHNTYCVISRVLASAADNNGRYIIVLFAIIYMDDT